MRTVKRKHRRKMTEQWIVPSHEINAVAIQEFLEAYPLVEQHIKPFLERHITSGFKSFLNWFQFGGKTLMGGAQYELNEWVYHMPHDGQRQMGWTHVFQYLWEKKYND